ncbi:hypothetical protein EJ110_NYTH09289 [Nymphaea thermarum]|nr:hypothetical protein EJ110_NYTH09289 [Nymphaea thermarum]
MIDAAQIAVPVLGILGAAALTFYVVSFNELREKSFKDLDGEDDDYGSEGATRWKSSLSSRERRSRRKSYKDERKKQ